MNIFYLDRDPARCATFHHDKHVVKMIVEYAQILSTAHRVLDGALIIDKSVSESGKTRRIRRWVLDDERETALYKSTHVQHPSMIWARYSKETYSYLLALLKALLNEYTFRYGKIHKTTQLLPYLEKFPTKFSCADGWCEPFMAMPVEYQQKDVLIAYRAYYNSSKISNAKWTNRKPPEWIGEIKCH